jgi:predicted metal-binding protein
MTMTAEDKRILDEIKKLDLSQADFIDPSMLLFEDEIRVMCAQNTCGRYGRTWNCPPVCGTVAELAAVCRSYGRGILFNKVSPLKDPLDWDGMMAGAKHLAGLLSHIDEKLRALDLPELSGTSDLLGTAGYRLFGGGACYACEDCSYPRLSCRHPDKLFTPIEACGINVMQLAHSTGLHYNNGENTVTFFGMLLYNPCQTAGAFPYPVSASRQLDRENDRHDNDGDESEDQNPTQRMRVIG